MDRPACARHQPPAAAAAQCGGGAAHPRRHAPRPARRPHAGLGDAPLTRAPARRRDGAAPARRAPPPPRAAADTAASDAAAAAAAAPLGAKDVPRSAVWELDFCSRPILDERGKKVWELLVCDPERRFEHAQFFPNNKITSAELARALEALAARPGAARPERVRFFRGQMATIISRGVADFGAAPVPSRRCFALQALLQERLEGVYKAHPGYTDVASPLFALDLGAPEELPDALRGERWSFVQLPLGALRAEVAAVEAGRAFGAGADLLGPAAAALDPALAAAADGTPVPGVAVYSRRADPMAAWTAGLELAALVADADRASLVLETGVSARWRYARWRRSPEASAEAAAWEAAKAAAGGLHFLAVMEDEEAEDCAGLWLLLDRKPPSF